MILNYFRLTSVSASRVISVLVLAALQFGCAEKPIRKDPAPVHRGKTHAKVKQAPAAPKTIEVFKYPEAAEIQLQEPVVAPKPILPPDMPSVPPENPAPITAPDLGGQSSATPIITPPAPAVPDVVMGNMPPAILALVTEADRNLATGNFESAAVKIERALRIDSRNAKLTYKLANIRLKQEQPRLAEDLAKKAELLAVGDRELKRQCWLLIAQSKRLQNDLQGALQAELNASQL